MNKNSLFNLLALMILLVVSLNFLLNLIDKRHKIFNKLSDNYTPSATEVINDRITMLNKKVDDVVLKLSFIESNSVEKKIDEEVKITNKKKMINLI